MVRIDTRYPRVRDRLYERADGRFDPLASRMVAWARHRVSMGLGVDLAPEWGGEFAAALGEVAYESVDEIGSRVTEALGGIVETRAEPWSVVGTANWRGRVALAIAQGKIEQANLALSAVPEEVREEVFSAVQQQLAAVGRESVDVFANFAAHDAARRADAASIKVWRHNGGSKEPRSEHVAMSGERRRLNEQFSNGLLYPASGPPAEAVGCRCTIDIIREADDAA